MQRGEHLKLQIDPGVGPVHPSEGLLDRIAHQIVGAPTIAGEHGGESA
jgi:hypothetical protein